MASCEHQKYIRLTSNSLVSIFIYLFLLQGGKELQAVESAEFDVEDDIDDSENEETQAREVSDEEMDSDEEQQRQLASTHQYAQLHGKYYISKNML